MKPRRNLLISALAVSIATATAGGAIAEDETANNDTNDQADIQMMMNARLSLADAIQAAETAQGGKALSAAFEANNGQVAYEVELAASDGNTSMVLIDGESGKALKVLTGTNHEGNDENGESGSDNGEDDAD